MIKLYAATQNKNKLAEFNALLSEKFEVLSIANLNVEHELPETGNTLEKNALEKARFIVANFNVNCFADDSGLEVESLNGEPGVYSARYAGNQKSANDNMNLLLENLKESGSRKAKFRTVIALILDEKEFLFQGEITGEITTEKCGVLGFGYDPIFKPHGFDITFAEMSANQKNMISHRAIAVNKMVKFLLKKN